MIDITEMEEIITNVRTSHDLLKGTSEQSIGRPDRAVRPKRCERASRRHLAAGEPEGSCKPPANVVGYPALVGRMSRLAPADGSLR